MKGLSRIALGFLLAYSAALLTACSPGQDDVGATADSEGSPAATAAETSVASVESALEVAEGKAYISDRLSLAIYLDESAETMTPGEQFLQNWPFDVSVKRADDDQIDVINNCSEAIAAYEKGQMPVEETDHQAFRQAVFLCYSAELVAAIDESEQILEAPMIDKNWIATLPADLSPATFVADEPESLLAEKSRWTDVSSVVSIGLDEPGLALVETDDQFQVINVLARGTLGGGSAEDLLILSVASSPTDGPEVMRLFLLGRDAGSTSFEVIRAF